MRTAYADSVSSQVGANAGVVGMAKEHLGLALALNVPVFVVVTKIDMCPANVLQETLKLLQRLLKSPGCRKIPVLVNSMDDVVVSATNFTSERLALLSNNSPTPLPTLFLLQPLNTIFKFQNVPHFPSVQRHWGESRPSEDVYESAVNTNRNETK